MTPHLVGHDYPLTSWGKRASGARGTGRSRVAADAGRPSVGAQRRDGWSGVETPVSRRVKGQPFRGPAHAHGSGRLPRPAGPPWRSLAGAGRRLAADQRAGALPALSMLASIYVGAVTLPPKPTGLDSTAAALHSHSSTTEPKRTPRGRDSPLKKYPCMSSLTPGG